MKARLWLLAVWGTGLSACSNPQPPLPIITYIPVETAQALGYKVAAPATTPEPNKQPVAARVNGQAILLEVYARQVTRFEQALSGANSQPDPAKLDEIRRQVLEMLIDQALIEQEAQRLQVNITAEELQAKTDEAVAARGPEQFNAWLVTNHLTRLEFAETLRSELMASRVFEQLTQHLSDDAAKQQFFQEWLAQQKLSARIERYVPL